MNLKKIKDNQIKKGLRGKTSRRVKDAQEYNYQPKSGIELNKLVSKLIAERGVNADLNDIDTSQVKYMEYTFSGDSSYYSDKVCKEFNGDISRWNVSNVLRMSGLFRNSEFNGDLTKWDASKLDKEKSWGIFFNSKITEDKLPEALKDKYLEDKQDWEELNRPSTFKVKGSKTAGVAVTGGTYEFYYFFGKKNDFANNKWFIDLFGDDGEFKDGSVHSAIVWGVENGELVDADIEDFKDLGTYIVYYSGMSHEPVIVQSNDVKELVRWILKDNEQGLYDVSEVYYDDREGYDDEIGVEVNGKDVSYEELVNYLKSLL